jgi:hypothetical protein
LTMDLKAHIVFYAKSKKLWARVRNPQREKLQIRGKQQKRSRVYSAPRCGSGNLGNVFYEIPSLAIFRSGAKEQMTSRQLDKL